MTAAATACPAEGGCAESLARRAVLLPLIEAYQAARNNGA